MCGVLVCFEPKGAAQPEREQVLKKRVRGSYCFAHVTNVVSHTLYYRGIAWAPATGVAMSELVLEGESKSINLSPFDPARFTPVAKRGGRGRKRQGENVGEQW